MTTINMWCAKQLMVNQLEEEEVAWLQPTMIISVTCNNYSLNAEEKINLCLTVSEKLNSGRTKLRHRRCTICKQTSHDKYKSEYAFNNTNYFTHSGYVSLNHCKYFVKRKEDCLVFITYQNKLILSDQNRHTYSFYIN